MKIDAGPLLLSLLLAVLPARASTISYTAATDDAQFASNGVAHFATGFDIPQFDPSLGTLDSIDYVLHWNALEPWNVISYIPSGVFDNDSDGSLQFMGRTAQWSFVQNTWGMPNPNSASSCGVPLFPQACPSLTGRIGPSGLALGFNLFGHVTDEVGDGPLGVTMSLRPYIVGANAALSADQAIVASFDLTWTYNYTPSEVSFVSVSAAPEPRWAVLLLGGILLVAIRKVKHK